MGSENLLEDYRSKLLLETEEDHELPLTDMERTLGVSTSVALSGGRGGKIALFRRSKVRNNSLESNVTPVVVVVVEASSDPM